MFSGLYLKHYFILSFFMYIYNIHGCTVELSTQLKKNMFQERPFDL